MPALEARGLLLDAVERSGGVVVEQLHLVQQHAPLAAREVAPHHVEHQLLRPRKGREVPELALLAAEVEAA